MRHFAIWIGVLLMLVFLALLFLLNHTSLSHL